MARLKGTGGDVFVASQLLEDCEDAWSVAGVGTATSAAVSTDAKVGSYSVKMVCGAGVNNGDILATEVITSVDITSYTTLMYWAKCSVAITTAGDLQVGVSETADLGGSPVYSDIPILAANTWKYCASTITTTGLNAVISVGAKLAANDPGAFDLYLDDIRAAKTVAGIKSWTLDQLVDVIDTTGFDSSGHRAYTPGLAGWAGTFEGFKEGLPLTIGSQVGLELRESATATQQFRGNAIITGLHATTAVDGVVVYSYDFQGTEALVIPTT